MEDKKQVGLIVTIVTVLLCGCPGLCIVASGAIFSFGGNVDSYSSNIDNPLTVGIPLLCIGMLMLLVPLAAGLYTFLQSRKAPDLKDIDIPEAL